MTVPFLSTLDKVQECEYFLGMMMVTYHAPMEFRFNLNAFIQALRNVTWMLQSEDDRPKGFSEWYALKQDEMRTNPLLRNFVDARNLLVKQQMLEASSRCWTGLYRGRQMKLAIGGEVPPLVPSEEYLRRFRDFAVDFFIDEGHSAIGEQLGVEKRWIVEAIGPNEVVEHCVQALEAIKSVVSEAVALVGGVFSASVEVPPTERFAVLLESDVDPTLPGKWGW